MNIRIASSQELPIEVSKWLQIQALLDTPELQNLFHFLGSFEIYLTGTITPQGEGLVSHSKFLEVYNTYVENLKQGKQLETAEVKQMFSAIFTVSSDLLYALPIAAGKQLIRVSRPVIQLQPHSLGYSSHDRKFRPMVHGTESLSWGLQFSYPQLYMDPSTKEILPIKDNDFFPNTKLFRQLQRWIRNHTIPTPFIVDEKIVNVPIRIGKQCLPWINEHPLLKSKKLRVKTDF